MAFRRIRHHREYARHRDYFGLFRLLPMGIFTDLRVTVSNQKATANYVPAAAVIRRWRALSGFIGRKGSVGGLLSLM